jgi:hypothetical protein
MEIAGAWQRRRRHAMKIMNIEIKDPLIKGHPLHAILTDLPVGALVAGSTFDLIGLITRRPRWRFAGGAYECLHQRLRDRARRSVGLPGRPD